MKARVVVSLFTLGLLGGCGATPEPDPVAAPPSTEASPSAPGPAAGSVPDWQHICTVNTGRGTYDLVISSAAAHDFSACGDAPEAFGSNIDTMLASGANRRCFLPMAGEAIIAVYSSPSASDRRAAASYCDDLGGTN